MTTHVIEGTWEEIERHKAEFVGYHLRVTVTRMRQTSQKTGKSAKQATVNSPQPRISAMGKYAGILSSEDFMRQKQEEIELEDRARK